MRGIEMKNGKQIKLDNDIKILGADGSVIRQTMDLKKAAKIVSQDGCDCELQPNARSCNCYQQAARALMIGGAQFLAIAKKEKERADKLEQQVRALEAHYGPLSQAMQ